MKINQNKIVFVLIILLFASNVLAQEIRVKIGSFKEVYFSSPDVYKIIKKASREILYQGNNHKIASVFERNIKISNMGVYENALIIESIPESFIEVNKRKYRGNIELRVSENSVKVINIIDIEKYLYGVVGMEVPPKWPTDALKAQAVISRTFALKTLNKHQDEDCNLCNSWHCQVYGGVNNEDPRVREAVDDTRGQVVVYKNEIIHASFHACCGGMTTECNLVWNGENYSYLRMVVDPFCGNSPHWRWEKVLSASLIRKKLLEKNISIGRIYSITLLDRKRDGRAKNILIRNSKERLIINSNSFRLIMDPLIVKSTNFTVTKRRDKFIFSGRGWGHGVGLCQWGAKAMAESGKSYTQILGFYYPGTNVKNTISLNMQEIFHKNDPLCKYHEENKSLNQNKN
ncbi:MAG: SpoIID/LytB domain-containing protein [bacterium]|nr:SpoIID/LytB domain-containing protein [bacterium]